MENAMVTSKTASVQVKFPLSPHKRGWCKKINGKVVVVCGHVSPDEALMLYHQKLPQILARQAHNASKSVVHTQPITPSVTQPIPVAVQQVKVDASLTVKQLCGKYLAKKRADIEANSFGIQSLMSTSEAINRLSRHLGGPVDQLKNQQFADYRHGLAKHFKSVFTLDRHISQIRAMFTWAVKNQHIDRLPPWGDSFDGATEKQLRQYQQKKRRENGVKTLTPDQIHSLIASVRIDVRAMVLLGINCALGNREVAHLTSADIDLDKGVLDYPRTKTSCERRAILWPETIVAVKEALSVRSPAAKAEWDNFVFLTPGGLPYIRTRFRDDGKVTHVDDLTTYFRRHREKQRENGSPIEKGISFYILRHTFRTVADELQDLRAINRVMGHAERSVAEKSYVHTTNKDFDKRLKVVSDHVWAWLYGHKSSAGTDMIVVSGL